MKTNYAKMFTLRPDGRYHGFWHDLDKDGKPIKSKRHSICDKDPERLFNRIREKETPKKRTFADVAGEWEEVHQQEVSARTWANYAPHLEDIVSIYGARSITDLTAYDVSQDLLAAKAQGYSHTVVNSRRSIWRGVFDYAIGQRDIPYNPAVSVKLPRGLKKGKRTAPTTEEINAVILGASDMDFGFIPFFLLCTGVRRAEALQRKKTDIDLKTWEMKIPKAKTPHGVRVVPIIEPLRELLTQWMDAHPGPWLFPYIPYNGRTGTYMSDSNWETAWGNYCTAHGWTDEEGKPTLGAHNLRHGTATLLYEAEVDVYTMKTILGHANIQTTLEIYTELRKSHETKNVAKFAESMKELQEKASRRKDAKK